MMTRSKMVSMTVMEKAATSSWDSSAVTSCCVWLDDETSVVSVRYEGHREVIASRVKSRKGAAGNDAMIPWYEPGAEMMMLDTPVCSD